MPLKPEAIKQWIADLTDASIKVNFDPEYECVTTDDGTLHGDAALFLAYRHADILDDSQLGAWYRDYPEDPYWLPSERIVQRFTGIPLVDAKRLLCPQEYLDGTLPCITRRSFVDVLKRYVKTGEVDWSPHVPSA